MMIIIKLLSIFCSTNKWLYRIYSKRLILILCTSFFCFTIENSFSQESVVIDQNELVTVDEVFKIIKAQTNYSFMYSNELFKNASKVELKKGEITVVELLKQSLSKLNYNFELLNNSIVIKRKNIIVVEPKKKKNTQKSELVGSVFEETTNQPLPYATVRLINTDYYTITNEDGKFEFLFDNSTKVDSLEVRFLGFATKKVPIEYFKKGSKLFLKPNVLQIEQVEISKTQNKDYAYNLLISLIKKYRNKDLAISSKAYLTLNSSARNVPIEHIEGFYNGKQSLSEGIQYLDIKSGRFGQNKAFPFYSLDNTTILEDFNLFKTLKQILPLYPGNLPLNSIKSKYKVIINQCSSCEDGNIQISFKPKKANGRLFSGNIIFQKNDLIIKSIKLKAINPKTHGLSSIIEKDIITPKEIKLKIVFNPLDLEKIQYFDFDFNVNYSSSSGSEYIKSNTFLYFYDFDKLFSKPYFTNNIQLRNDYDKIVALQTPLEFWNASNLFPESFEKMKTMNFMKQHGYLINYDNRIPEDYMKYINPSVISWSKDNRLSWDGIKAKKLVNKNKNTLKNYNLKDQMESNKVSYSSSGSSMAKSKKRIKERFQFEYLIDYFKNGDKENVYTTRTIFNRNESYFNGTETDNKLIYINLMFDIYEYYRIKLSREIKQEMSFNEVKELCNKKYEEAKGTILKMKKKTNSGSNSPNLIIWNNKLKHKLKIDNYQLISKEN